MRLSAKKYSLLATVAVGMIMSAQAAMAGSLTMNVTYYTVSESDPDFNTNPCCSNISYNESQATLGPDGLPVYNPNYTINGNNPGTPLLDVNSSGELTWWSPSMNPNVTQTGTGVVTLPYSNQNFFPPNGTGSNDANGFQAAVFTGVLVVPTTEQVQFEFGADDDAFLAVGNTIIDQIGAIHGDSPAPVDTEVLDPGNYAITIFYTDRHQTGAGFTFSVDTQDVTVNSVPVPGALALFGLGLAGLGAMRRRKAQ